VRQRLWDIDLRLSGLRKEDEHPAYTLLEQYTTLYLFSERGFTFTFAIMLSLVRLSSVCL